MPMIFRRKVFALLALAYISLECNLHGQQQDTTGAIAIINRSLGTMVSGSQPLHDITLQGNVEYIAGSTDENGTIRLKAITDGSSRTEITLPSHVIRESVIRSGSRLSGQKDDGSSTIHTTAWHNLMTDSAWFFPAILIQHFVAFARAGEVTASMTTDQNGASVQKLKSYRHVSNGNVATSQEFQRLTATNIFIDPTSSQPTSFTYNTHPEDNSLINIPVSIVYEEYKPFDGVMVPTRIKRYLNGVLALDIHIVSATINSDMNSASFQLK